MDVEVSIKRRKLLKQAKKPWQAIKHMARKVLANTHIFVGAEMMRLVGASWRSKSGIESRVDAGKRLFLIQKSPIRGALFLQ